MGEKLKILIIGAGKGGASLIEILSDEPFVELAGIMDRDPDAPGIKRAQEEGIPVYPTMDEGVEKTGADIVFNVTGDEELTGLLTDKLKSRAACIGGQSAKFFWTLLKDKKRGLKDLKRLYEIGVEISSFTSSEGLFKFFLDRSRELTGTDAASIAIYDEKSSELQIVAAEGFSDEFVKGSLHWSARVKGLTATVLNSKEPVIIEDAENHPAFTNPLLKKEGIKALMASTIRSQNKIVGISYVNSFTPKKFLESETTAFRLLATQAATAIEKTNVIQKYHTLAFRDELTGLSNYRHFLESGRAEFNRAKRYGHPFALLIMDIDHFKGYNDSFGHEAGNYIIKQLGAIIKKSFRDTDTTARYGGEEFVVIMVEADKRNAHKKADEFRKKCREELRPEKDPEIFRNVTISIGVASYPEDSGELPGLIGKADGALYRAKEQGRDRVASD
ncbi:MAG: diguanylate cyclase [Thermodesulfobacteriota bacterium]